MLTTEWWAVIVSVLAIVGQLVTALVVLYFKSQISPIRETINVHTKLLEDRRQQEIKLFESDADQGERIATLEGKSLSDDCS